jgi:aspartate aminotransferase
MDLPIEATHSMRDAFKKRRDLVYERLKKMPGLKVNLPEGAFYFFPEISDFIGKTYNNYTIKNGTDLCNFLLDEAHLALVPGAAFGDDHYIRLSYATSEDKLTKAMDRLETALLKLRG